MICAEGTGALPFDVQAYRAIFYRRNALAELRDRLEDALRALPNTTEVSRGSNPVREFGPPAFTVPYRSKLVGRALHDLLALSHGAWACLSMEARDGREFERPSDGVVLERATGSTWVPRRRAAEVSSRMATRVVRLGSPRARGEGLRLGTVRRPPRGVPKAEHASRDFYDVWLPALAPSEGLVKQALKASDERSWRAFTAKYRAEMKRPEAARLLELLAALSRQADFSVGCYCAEEARCHRSVLRELLQEHGAVLA
jgi:uncharacterized protein YeaO (DUF488 family)